MADRKKQIRFNEKDDINLMREVLGLNPFMNKSLWGNVAEQLDLNVDSRRVRERTMLLVSQQRDVNSSAKKLSGVVEVLTERETLRQELLELYEEQERAKGINRKETEAAQEIRKRAMEACKEDDKVVPRKKKEDELLGYLRNKSDNENRIKEKELELKQEEIRLQARQFEIERKERLQALENQKNQSDMMMEIFRMLSKK